MLHVYCIVRAGDPPPPPGLTGVDGAAVSRVEHAGLAAWVSAATRGEPSAARLRAHDAVVRAALRCGTPLPARFGEPVSDDGALRRMLDARAEPWRAALERVAGRVEIGVAVPAAAADAVPGPAVAADDAGEAPASGRAYLERRRVAAAAREAGRDAAAARVAAAEGCIGAVPWPAARSVVARGGLAGTLSFLVPRGEAGEFRRRAEAALDGCLPPPRALVTGPHAPYAFV